MKPLYFLYLISMVKLNGEKYNLEKNQHKSIFQRLINLHERSRMHDFLSSLKLVAANLSTYHCHVIFTKSRQCHNEWRGRAWH